MSETTIEQLLQCLPREKAGYVRLMTKLQNFVESHSEQNAVVKIYDSQQSPVEKLQDIQRSEGATIRLDVSGYHEIIEISWDANLGGSSQVADKSRVVMPLRIYYTGEAILLSADSYISLAAHQDFLAEIFDMISYPIMVQDLQRWTWTNSAYKTGVGAKDY